VGLACPRDRRRRSECVEEPSYMVISRTGIDQTDRTECQWMWRMLRLAALHSSSLPTAVSIVL
jgi:hypothetical protein